MSPSRIIAILLTVVGLCAISVDDAGTLYMSVKKIIYSVFLAVLISCGLYFQVATYFELRDGESLLHGLLYLYPMVADSVMSVLIILSSLYSNRVFLGFVRLRENRVICLALIRECHFQQIGRNLAITGLIFVGPYLLDFFYYYSSIQSRTALYQALSYIFVLYNYVYLNQFSIALGIVQSVYRAINRRLLNLCEKGVEDVERLYGIRNEHHGMLKVFRTINWMFALTTIGLFAHHGMLGIIYSYWGLRQMISKQGADVGELINTFRSAALSFLSIVWLVASTVKISAQVEKTKQLIQNALINMKNAAFLSEVQTFALQLTISDAIFSPYGFFEFNNELLSSMLSGVVSYLIILLQYQVMLDEQA